MKIAILTQPLGRNYGGLLQAYALQAFLKKAGHEVVTVDRKKPLPTRLKHKKNFSTILKKTVGKFRGISLTSDTEYRYKSLYDFRKNNISLTPLFVSDEQVVNHFKENRYDLIVVGSDQVWRPKYSPSIELYFGSFYDQTTNEVRIISYAASYGVDDWEFTGKQTVKCKNLVQRFEGISVRETSGVALSKNKLNADAEVVVDPTLLLKREDYEALIQTKQDLKPSGKVLSYILDPSESKQNTAYTISDHLKSSVVHIMPQKRHGLERLKSLIKVNPDQYVPVEDWLKYFNSASFVVTDSFHGCIFSILFNKPFIAVGNVDRGLARFNTLLSMVGLEERLIFSADELTVEKIESPIDWEQVNERVNENAIRSKEYLESFTKVM